MIIAKGEFVTSKVSFCKFNVGTNKWDITFNNGRTYSYNAENVTFIKDPVSLNLQDFQVRHNGKSLNSISAIYSFKSAEKEYWHICFTNGQERDYCIDDFEIRKNILVHPGARRVFEYLEEVAGYISVKTQDDTAILLKQYERVNYIDDETVAAVYLNPERYKSESDLDSTAPIFPFGCNESQYIAVTNALSNRVSVIEGPPGTGKTQTILNIIANLVLQGKTVQVVSNNNSAVDNVIEKMASPEYGLDFIVAPLGREEKKQNFISAQSGAYPELEGWKLDTEDPQEFLSSLQEKAHLLQRVFREKNQLAKLRQELYDVHLEQEHFESLIPEKSLIITGKKLSSDKLMEFWQEYQDIQDGNKNAGLIYRIIRYFTHGISVRTLLKSDTDAVVNGIQYLYYNTKAEEIQIEIKAIEQKLDKLDADALMAELKEMSLQYFRDEMVKRYQHKNSRKTFTMEDLWKNPEIFLTEYPVVLSTTYTARSSLGKDARFDYVIMDEASQIDVATGMLSLSCARNAVIVGDTKQLPNVVTEKQKRPLSSIYQKHNIPNAYDYTEHSFLQSVCILLGKQVPQVTLLEHYRCHPQIIGFCNQKFYNGNLVIMTDQKNAHALQLVTTVEGNHSRGHINQRQIDVIRAEILPELDCSASEIGIIAPYRDQVGQLVKDIANPEIDIATVHKFQGREKDVIIFSIVDDIVTIFSDDPNLLNVAVSRAKKKLIIVASDKNQPVGSNVGDLIGYIRYNNCDIRHSAISSVFDYLYAEYAERRHEYLKKQKRISEYDSENLMYGLIQEELEKREDIALDVICHQPLQLLFRDQSRMTEEERRFVNTGLSHLDFLIYNKVSKQPLLAIEVDGFQHFKDEKQKARDKKKDHILEVYGLPLIRFATNGSDERIRLTQELDKLIWKSKEPVEAI